MRWNRYLWRSFYGSLVLAVGLSLGGGAGPAEASDGLCWSLCEIEVSRCTWAAGCRPSTCRDGSECRGGRCDDGTQCSAWPCDPTQCYEDYFACKEGCRDWWLPELGVVVEFEIPDLVRKELVLELEGIELAVEEGLREIEASLRKHLDNYRQKILQLEASQQVDPGAALALTSLAAQVEANLTFEKMQERIMAEPSP